jgi:deoxycytidine triphosphate deaminase
VEHPAVESEVLPSRSWEERLVPSLITDSQLREAVERQTFIKQGTPRSVEGMKVDLHMSDRVLKASYRQPINISELGAVERSSLVVEPGEVVFVLTKEILKLPNTMMAMLSPKRALTHSGILVLGGFAIDPNYWGVLWFGLYNLSTTSFPITAGKKLIAAMFYQLGETEAVAPSADSECLSDFPDELISLIRNYKPIELKGLQEELEETKRQLSLLRTDINNDRDWRNAFKEGLDKHGHQLDQLIEGLKDERELRRQEDTRISTKLDSLQGAFAGLRIAWLAVAFLIGAIVTAAVAWEFGRVVDHVQAPLATVPTNPQAAPLPAPAPPVPLERTPPKTSPG